MAIIISWSQCNISNRQTELLKLQTKIAENTYYSSIDPVILCQFEDHNKNNVYEFIIKNIGISTVYDIEIKNSLRIFGPDFDSAPVSMKDMEYKKIAQQIDSGDSCIYTIPKDYYTQPALYDIIRKDVSIFPIITSQFSYKRFPDKKQYYLTKYIFVLFNPEKGIIGSVDLDKDLFDPEFINKKYLKDYDSKYN